MGSRRKSFGLYSSVHRGFYCPFPELPYTLDSSLQLSPAPAPHLDPVNISKVWDHPAKPHQYFYIESSIKYNDIGRFKNRKKILYANTVVNKVRLAPLILNRVDFRAKKITRNRKRCYPI